jgi:glycosyltransferase involved in cell wall biosynthesis
MNNFTYLDRAPAKYTSKLCSRHLEQLRGCSSRYAKAPVVIAITHKDQNNYLCNALRSALMQTLVISEQAQIVVLEDSSAQSWTSELNTLFEHPSITLLQAECGSPARARNLLLDWADKSFHINWISRLDADDELAHPNSLEALFNAGEKQASLAVIGSNQLRVNGEIMTQSNIADAKVLINRELLVNFIVRFCSGEQRTELPSCNLMLKNNLGVRYPNIRSAEDHWLVARLLMENTNKIAIVAEPYYCVYSLDGTDTKNNKTNNVWKEQRDRLSIAVESWLNILNSERTLLGFGLEGAVWLEHKQVIKQFYPWAITDNDVSHLKDILAKPIAFVPTVEWTKNNGQWSYTTPDERLIPVPHTLPLDTVKEFLCGLYNEGICALNIKRDNLMLNEAGQIVYVDVGKDIQSLTSSYFLDMTARLYSIAILGNADEEFVRRKSWRSEVESLKELDRFDVFYSELIAELHSCKLLNNHQLLENIPARNSDVTLLIKVCAQDAQGLYEQISHIVTQLSYPVRFNKVQLLVDEYPGPFLRQYAKADISFVKEQALQLVSAGLIDEFITAPQCENIISSIYSRWFDCSNIKQTHTINNAPLYPQIWALSNVDTRYVLQCDCDVLIGRKDWEHDYLADMIIGCEPAAVQSVGFNIPKETNKFLNYHGSSGEFPPEVRFGLLDLHKIKCSMPMSNPSENGHFTLTWHRAIQANQLKQGTCSVRGGDPASFYVHPRNEDKTFLLNKPVRDLIAQGEVPKGQKELFDLTIDEAWQYPRRQEEVVFLLKGKGTPYYLLNRCLKSLQQQRNQSFGIILIDDAGGSQHNWCYVNALQNFKGRTTLIRHSQRQGRIPNFIMAVEQVCKNPNTLIAVLDQDDCLLQDTIVDQLLKAKYLGHDLIQMPMFRPNKPLKLYQPDYENPRQKAGANVWSHLRIFKKSLFERIPKSYFKTSNGDFFDKATDYLTMLPMVELASKPIFIDTGYAYFHDRNDYSLAEKEHEKRLIHELLNKPSLLIAAVPKQVDAECHS